MKQNNQSGFTLIELLVSLFLLSMVMTLIYGTLSFSTKALERNIEIAEKSDDVLPSQKLLRDLIGRSVPQRAKFSGSNSKVDFISRMARGGGTPEQYQVSIFDKPSRTGSDLVLRWEKENKDFEIGNMNGDMFQGEVVLANDISDLNISYGARDFYETRVWQPLWSNNEEQPRFIKIGLESDQIWPEMVIELNITHTVDCFYDPVSRGCRQR